MSKSESSEDLGKLREELGITDDDLGEIVGMHRQLARPSKQTRTQRGPTPRPPLSREFEIEEDSDEVLPANEYAVLSDFFKTRDQDWWSLPAKHCERDVDFVIESILKLRKGIRRA